MLLSFYSQPLEIVFILEHSLKQFVDDGVRSKERHITEDPFTDRMMKCDSPVVLNTDFSHKHFRNCNCAVSETKKITFLKPQNLTTNMTGFF